MLSLCLGDDEQGSRIGRKFPPDLSESGKGHALIAAYDAGRNSCNERTAKQRRESLHQRRFGTVHCRGALASFCVHLAPGVRRDKGSIVSDNNILRESHVDCSQVGDGVVARGVSCDYYERVVGSFHELSPLFSAPAAAVAATSISQCLLMTSLEVELLLRVG